jgi:hypothetical protein
MEPQSRVRLQDGDFLESSKVLVSPSSDEESGQVFFSLYFDANNQAILADFIGLNFLQLVDLTAFSGKEGSSIQISLTEICAHLPLDFEIVNFEGVAMKGSLVRGLFDGYWTLYPDAAIPSGPYRLRIKFA